MKNLERTVESYYFIRENKDNVTIAYDGKRLMVCEGDKIIDDIKYCNYETFEDKLREYNGKDYTMVYSIMKGVVE